MSYTTNCQTASWSIRRRKEMHMKDVINVLAFVQLCTLCKIFNNYDATVINGSVQYISQLSIHSNFRTWHVCLTVISFITEQFKLQYYISRGWKAMDAVCKQASTQIWTWYVRIHRARIRISDADAIGCAAIYSYNRLLPLYRRRCSPLAEQLCIFTHSMECSIRSHSSRDI